MERLTLDLPMMYGDHHVIEVRHILLAMAGVQEVYASSCFQIVEVAYDPNLTGVEAIKARLDEAGYLEDLAAETEAMQPSASSPQDSPRFRHTTAYQQTGRVISFAQAVHDAGRSLWPCPGMGAIKENGHGEKRA